MTVKRVKCSDCDNFILQATAERNEGLCGHCVKFPKEVRDKVKAVRERIKSGNLAPTAEELATAQKPQALYSKTEWQVETDFHLHFSPTDLKGAIAQAKGEICGNLFLISPKRERLNLHFNDYYAACAYKDSVHYLYAHTDDNLKTQVEADMHLSLDCPCCGVGLSYTHSRAHMPRDKAFALLEQIIETGSPETVLWLDMGEVNFVSRGRG